MRHIVHCCMGHRKTFRGPFAERRINRWLDKHYHPEYKE